jgi:multiple sugar transport system substrate-binding protein
LNAFGPIPRNQAIGLAVALVSIAAAACNFARAPSPGIVLTISDYSTEQSSFHQQVAAEYHREHPNVTIQWTSITQQQYEQTLPLAFQSHQAPDVFFWKAGSNEVLTMSYLLREGWIRPLGNDGKVPADWMKRWPDGSFQQGINVKDGKVYGFPFTDDKVWGPGYFYWNKALFKEAGLDENKPPATWNDLAQDCAAIKAREPDKYCAAVPLKGTDPQRWWYNLAGSIMVDSPFFDLKNGRFDINDPKLLKAFAYLQGLYEAGYVAPGINDKDFSREQIATGQAAMYMDGAWMPGVWAAQGFDSSKYGVAPMPYPDDEPHGALSQRNSENKYWISNQSAHPQQAWQFLEWMTQPDGYFAQGYLKGGFGTLAFADNQRYLTDPAMQQVMMIGETKGFRVIQPEPLLQCPSLADSHAFTDASAMHPNWEWEEIVDALVNHKNFATEATTVANARQRVLTDELAKERAAGLKVSLSCYTFSDWNYDQDFDQSKYPKQ